MKFYEIEPFIRFAEHVKFSSESNWTYVQDCRLIYLLSGSAVLHMKNQQYHLTPGSLFYCCRGEIYNFESTEVMMIAVNFDLDRSTPFGKPFYPRISIDPSASSPLDSYHIEDCEFLNSHFFLQNASSYFLSLQSIVDEFANCPLLYEEKACALLRQILIDLHRKSQQLDKQPSNLVQKVIAYINANFDRPISNQSVAELLGYHHHYLNRIFTQQMGKTIHQYLLSVRLLEAQRMLLTSDLPLAAIAEKSGFCSYSHFSSYFKRETGVSPLVYRANRDKL